MRDADTVKIYPDLPTQEPSAPNIYAAIPALASSLTGGSSVPPLPTAKELSKSIRDATGRVGEPQVGHNFRLQKINEIKLYLEAERDSRRIVAKKYKKAINILTGFAYAFETAAVGLGAAGVGLLTTVIAAPIVVGMEIVAIGTGGLSVTGNLICDKILNKKLTKHNLIKMLAESKLNSINDHVSKALIDGFISDEEFTLILSEMEKYTKLKEDLKSKSKHSIDEETKQSLIQQGKDRAISEFQSMLASDGTRKHR